MKRLSARTSPATRGTNEFRAGLVLVASLLGVFWVLEIVDQVALSSALDAYGILPRTGEGLLGILFSPFLHGGFGHLISNSIPFLVLGGLLALRGRGHFIKVSLMIMVLGGAAVWLLGREAIHIGASGVIFGYLGYLLANGWFERSVQSIAVAIGVGVVYGGLIWGVLPSQPGVSWEGHLFGFLAGALTAKVLVPTSGTKKAKKASPFA